MKKIGFVLFFGIFSLMFGQKHSVNDFDIKDFNNKMEVVEWLYRYDIVAWHTSDVVVTNDKKDLERIGEEWFCFEKNNQWHAVYGKYDNAEYDLVFHYVMDEKGEISEEKEKPDQTFLNRHAKALNTVNNHLREHKEMAGVRFNQYIRENENKTFSVWIFPAFQPNNVAVYGGEHIFTLDSNGEEILKDESYFKGNYYGFEVNTPREIWLDYNEMDNPSLGAVFFVWYYKSYFTQIGIETAKSNSFLIKNGDEWSWVHGMK